VVNSLGHRLGRRRFDTRDDSRNSMWLALLAWGEGWHNNHHRVPASARQGFRWWEVDLTWYCLRLLRRLGVVWDVVEPPAEPRGGAVAGRQPRCHGDFTDSVLEPADHAR
jgi:stearoyl-CoA desaturase (delta-9 desaturase)